MKSKLIFFWLITLNVGCMYQKFGSLDSYGKKFKAYLAKSPPFEFSVIKKESGTKERWTISGSELDCEITKFYYELDGRMYYGVDSMSNGSYFFKGIQISASSGKDKLIPVDTNDMNAVLFLISKSNYKCSHNSIVAARKVIGYVQPLN